MILEWKQIAKTDVDPTDEILMLGKEIMTLGIKDKDALHIACAIKADCDYFLTTDKKVLNKNVPNIKIINPIDFIRNLEV